MITGNQLVTEIIDKSYTFFQVIRRLRIIREQLEKKLFGTEKVIEELSAEDQNWYATLEPSFWQQFNQENFQDIFQQASTEVEKITPLIIYIPFELPDEEIRRLGEYIKSNFGRNNLMELRYDPSLIAGCSISWKGNMRDYSLRNRISQAREEIFSTFKGYVK